MDTRQQNRLFNQTRRKTGCIFVIIIVFCLCSMPVIYTFASVYYEEHILVDKKKREVKQWLEQTQREILDISQDDELLSQTAIEIEVGGTMQCVSGDTTLVFKPSRTWDEIIVDYQDSLGTAWEIKETSSESLFDVRLTHIDAKYPNFIDIRFAEENNTYSVRIFMSECYGG